MASEDTALGNDLVLQIGTGDSPEEFLDFCAVNAVEGLGESKPLVDVTTMCDNARAFRNGLREGAELTINANLIRGDAQTRDLFQRYKVDEIVNWRLPFKDDSPSEEYFAFSTTILGWTLGSPIGDKATMQFSVKVTGGVDWVYS